MGWNKETQTESEIPGGDGLKRKRKVCHSLKAVTDISQDCVSTVFTWRGADKQTSMGFKRWQGIWGEKKNVPFDSSLGEEQLWNLCR